MLSAPLLLNFVLCGDCGVGKSALVQSLVYSDFQPRYQPTVSTEVQSTHVQASTGQNVQLQLWDTAGDERYRSLGAVFFRSAHCCLLFCDLTNPKSLDNLETWRSEFLALASPAQPHNFPFAVISMKRDREKDRRFPYTKAYRWTRNKVNCMYFEVSAMDFEEVRRVFGEIVDRVINGEGYKQAEATLSTPYIARKRRCRCC